MSTPMFWELIQLRNPPGLGKWLARQCLGMGVEFRTGWKVVGVNLSAGNKVQAVTCLKDDRTMTRIDCKQLLLACGPWTPTVYERLFPSSTIHLQWTTNAGDWILCKNPCLTTQGSVAFVSFNGLIGEKFEFAGRNDGTIWACGRRNLTAALPSPSQLDTPDQKVIEELRGRAREWLNWGCNCAEKHANDFQVVDQGRAFRPATKSGLPIMSEVLSSDISTKGTEDSQAATGSSQVFVCWGHGSWGLTLGMGSGKLMSQVKCQEARQIFTQWKGIQAEMQKEAVRKATIESLNMPPIFTLSKPTFRHLVSTNMHESAE
ncbi:hypothetical protein TOPH_05321 [Tolypocladium ophioglossoides CBS 100239]|uniref:FAD dependent oxidoreductase domain-containing protein n=1 Tax=Tolypocladium ophioglossoides (strain CBS 100239) TaxID=1163406 RepID=A0A0L0N7I7_TOLOC|nr:hypothetical protein TOPH_05321 [Tolypocladium ophioglossoides CBS 100239]